MKFGMIAAMAGLAGCGELKAGDADNHPSTINEKETVITNSNGTITRTKRSEREIKDADGNVIGHETSVYSETVPQGESSSEKKSEVKDTKDKTAGPESAAEKVAEKSLAPGDHGTTYGGNPLVCAAVDTVLQIFEEEQVLSHVKQVSAYLEAKLEELVASSDEAICRRGKGLMQGLVLKKPVGEVIKKAMAHGLIVISAGGNVLRMVPPLIIKEEQVDEMIEILSQALNE
jgi:hypothetical protein